MKINVSVILSAMFSTCLLVQSVSADSALTTSDASGTNLAPAAVMAAPAAATTAPSKHTKKKSTKGKKSAKAEPIVSLVPGTAVVVGNGVNVRAQPNLSGEVITHLTNGDSVTVIEEINLEKAKSGEPKQWAKIAFPASVGAWVHTEYIDTATMTVKPKKLNLRAGPGENYSVVGTLEGGASVKQLESKGSWIQIEPPAGAYAFVAAEYLHQEPPAVAATVPAADAAVAAAAIDATNAMPAVDTQTSTNAETQPPAEPVIVPRVVSHEGQVRRTISIQAPTDFQLVSVQTGKIINYLYSTNKDLDLKAYNGHMIVASGEESLDERWKHTPVLTVQQIQVVQ